MTFAERGLAPLSFYDPFLSMVCRIVDGPESHLFLYGQNLYGLFSLFCCYWLV
jgi:hypothetical protein